MKKYALTLMSTAAIAVMLSSCGNSPANPETSATLPPQKFQVMELSAQSATLYLTFPAVLQGKQNIEIRPKVEGFIEGIFFDEGSIVKKGQRLFKINAPQYEQEVRNSLALVTSAEADLNTAQLQYNKTKPLVDKGIISHYELEFAENAIKSKKAILAQAQANLYNARTNLGYTNIASPVDGIASAVPYKLGSLVNSQNPQPLTTISNNGNVYAYVSLNEKQLLEFSRNYKGSNIAQKLKNLPEVSLTLSDGTAYPHTGRVETVNGLINTETGSASFRAIFPNPDGLIRSGGSATLRVPQSITHALLVPQKSTYELQGKHFIYTVGADNVIKSSEINIANLTTGQLYVVNSGVKAGDRIVIESAGNLKDGLKIQPDMVSSSKIYEELK